MSLLRFWRSTARLPPLLTYRRKRTVTVSTPTGGVIVREIEEEVG